MKGRNVRDGRQGDVLQTLDSGAAVAHRNDRHGATGERETAVGRPPTGRALVFVEPETKQKMTCALACHVDVAACSVFARDPVPRIDFPCESVNDRACCSGQGGRGRLLARTCIHHSPFSRVGAFVTLVFTEVS